MKRTMDLLALFDSDSFVSQRVHLFDVNNGRPTDLVKQLESIFKAVSLSEKATAVKFVPIDRYELHRGGFLGKRDSFENGLQLFHQIRGPAIVDVEQVHALAHEV